MPRYALAAMARQEKPGLAQMVQRLAVTTAVSENEAKGWLMSHLGKEPDAADRTICGILVMEIE